MTAAWACQIASGHHPGVAEAACLRAVSIAIAAVNGAGETRAGPPRGAGGDRNTRPAATAGSAQRAGRGFR